MIVSTSHRSFELIMPERILPGLVQVPAWQVFLREFLVDPAEYLTTDDIRDCIAKQKHVLVLCFESQMLCILLQQIPLPE